MPHHTRHLYSCRRDNRVHRARTSDIARGNKIAEVFSTKLPKWHAVNARETVVDRAITRSLPEGHVDRRVQLQYHRKEHKNRRPHTGHSSCTAPYNSPLWSEARIAKFRSVAIGFRVARLVALAAAALTEDLTRGRLAPTSETHASPIPCSPSPGEHTSTGFFSTSLRETQLCS